jgi:hypothetical protein
MPASQAPQPSATPSPTRTRRSQPCSTSKLKITTTASIAIFAIAAHADEREAHIREVQQFSKTLPEDSYTRRNRQAIAARETRIAARLRAVEQACQTALDRDTAPTSPQPARAPHSPEHANDKAIGFEAEP